MTSPPSLHILIVEDNDGLREATMDFLNEHGHHATGVGSAEEVDDIALRDVPDLYLIDINLPGENGFALTQRIRKSQPLAGIVLMTARGQLHDRLDGYQHGADNYLIKPVEQAELLACIHSLAFRLQSSRQSTTAGLVLHSAALRLSGSTGEAFLSHGESLLLAAFCRAAGQKLERWQAMQLVDSKDKGLSPANLEMRISALRKKMSQCGAPDSPILTLRGFGYALGCQVEVR
ncbi:MAG: response regulator transcription factor [Simplicispira sp.]|nr:response regulator transcription factor [Simplicispira sp.]